MPSRTDNKCSGIKICAVAAAFIYFLTSISAASGILISEKYMEINGPATVSLRDINMIKSETIDSKTMIHLPSSVKTLLVEDFNYSPRLLSDELRAYTLQQAVFWTVATLALGSAVARR